MERLIGRICTYCVRNKIIPAEKAPWLAYGLEKRLTTWIAMPPFLLLSVVCIGFWQTVAFFCSFFLLRSRLNGYHAYKYIRCFFLSLLTEVFFLLLVYPLINEWSSILLVVLNVVLVFWLAPYNHPNMNLSDEEYIACRRSARIYACFIGAAFTVLYIIDLHSLAYSVVLGMTMAVVLLCVAYYRKEGT